MGICSINDDRRKQSYSNNEKTKSVNKDLEISSNKKIKHVNYFIDPDDIIKLKTATCQIKTQKGLGTGAFCYIIKMFMHCLITHEHIITEEMIKNKETITISYNEINKIGKITKEILLDKRKIFYFKESIDITIVELFPEISSDGIEKERFLEPFYLNENENLNEIIQKNNFILLQYKNGDENLKVDLGNITEINENNYTFKYNTNNIEESYGGPIIYKDEKNNYLLFGIYYKETTINQGNILYKILKRFKKIIYKIEEKGEFRILSSNFIENNKHNIELLINGEKHNLTENYNFEKIGQNEIYIIEKNYITDMSYMFNWCNSIESLEPLRNWDVSKVEKMSDMFRDCNSIESLEPLRKWDVSKVKDMNGMFYDCSFIKSLEPLKNWDVSKVKDMNGMFRGCIYIENLEPLLSWDVSKVKDMSFMFAWSKSIQSLEGLRNWNVSKVKDMINMFYECKSIHSVEPLKNWNVSNVKNMESMFGGCESIKSFDPIKNWSNLTIAFSIRKVKIYFNS